MRFIITHPMHTHPYNPELVTGASIANVAAGTEAAGFSDSGSPTTPHRRSGGWSPVDTTRSIPLWRGMRPLPPHCV